MKRVKTKFNNYIRSFNLKSFLVLFLDAAVISLSFLMAVLIKGDLSITYDIFERYMTEIPVVIIVYFVVFELFNMNKNLWKFAGIEELLKAIMANGVAILSSFILIHFVFDKHLSFGFYIIAFFVITFSTLLSRTFYRVLVTTKTLFRYKTNHKY